MTNAIWRLFTKPTYSAQRLSNSVLLTVTFCKTNDQKIKNEISGGEQGEIKNWHHTGDQDKPYDRRCNGIVGVYPHDHLFCLPWPSLFTEIEYSNGKPSISNDSRHHRGILRTVSDLISISSSWMQTKVMEAVCIWYFVGYKNVMCVKNFFAGCRYSHAVDVVHL